MHELTAADFADTGQWRLLIHIRKDGMDAWLEHVEFKDIEPQLLFSSKWDVSEGDLLKNIENAVYDHPRVLDDFATRLVLFDNKTLFIPSVVADETEGGEEEIYSEVYQADPQDTITVRDKDLISAFSMAQGLKSFLYRTFPGARITSNLSEKVKILRHSGSGNRVFAIARGNETDILMFKGDSLISASTRDTVSANDIVYYIFNLFDLYNVSPKSVTVRIEGIEIPDEMIDFLKKTTSYSG